MKETTVQVDGMVSIFGRRRRPEADQAPRARLLEATWPEHCLYPFYRFRQTKNGESSAGRGHDLMRPMTSWRSVWQSLVRRLVCLG
jgi:hypothetical protein